MQLSQNCRNPKMVGLRAKQTIIWDSGVLVTHIWGTFDYKVNTILESFGALISPQSVTHKLLIVEQNWLTFWDSGTMVTPIQGTVDL